MSYKIAVLPGDGIGPEVMREGTQVLNQAAMLHGFKVEMEEGVVGGASIDAHGKPLTDSVLKLAKESNAVLLGAMGGPKWDGLDYSIRPERALLALRQELGLFANLRPVKLFSALASASTLKKEVVEGTDLLVVRELTGGIYFGQPKGVTKLPDGTERGVNTEVYTTPEIERIAVVAFEAARKRRRKVTSVDKANVLEVTELWRKVVTRVHKEKRLRGYPARTCTRRQLCDAVDSRPKAVRCDGNDEYVRRYFKRRSGDVDGLHRDVAFGQPGRKSRDV